MHLVGNSCHGAEAPSESLPLPRTGPPWCSASLSDQEQLPECVLGAGAVEGLSSCSCQLARYVLTAATSYPPVNADSAAWLPSFSYLFSPIIVP